MRTLSDKLPPVPSEWTGGIARELAKRREVEFDTFLPTEVLSPVYEGYDVFSPEVEEDGTVWCPAAEYYFGVGLGGLFDCARILYDVILQLLRSDNSKRYSPEILNIACILSRPDRIFVGMVFKELELRGLPEKRTMEIEGKGIKLIIELVKPRNMTQDKELS